MGNLAPVTWYFYGKEMDLLTVEEALREHPQCITVISRGTKECFKKSQEAVLETQGYEGKFWGRREMSPLQLYLLYHNALH